MFAAYAQLKRARNGGGLEPRLTLAHVGQSGNEDKPPIIERVGGREISKDNCHSVHYHDYSSCTFINIIFIIIVNECPFQEICGSYS